MPQNWIKNYNEIATTPARKMALALVSAGLDAIETKSIIDKSVSLTGDILRVKDMEINLAEYGQIFIVGFGKAATEAALALENILGDKITEGAVIGLFHQANFKKIRGFVGTHPKPSEENVAASQAIVDLAQGITEKDLVIVVVSGGGSAMLCWPETEREQSQKLYDDFLSTGGNIQELNTVRKHISMVKGGGLAKLFYPAKIVGLIFCDIPGNKYFDVASGPTFKDTATVVEAQNVLDKYGLSGFTLNETEKDDKYFANVTNIPLVSNETALAAMAEKAKLLGFTTKIFSSEIYEPAEETIKKMIACLSEETDLVLAGGEIRLVIEKAVDKSGRNQFMALTALGLIKEKQLFISLASDGIDNADAAGAIADELTIKKYKELNLALEKYLVSHDTYNFFSSTSDLIFTGPTGANVADLMLLLKYRE